MAKRRIDFARMGLGPKPWPEKVFRSDYPCAWWLRWQQGTGNSVPETLQLNRPRRCKGAPTSVGLQNLNVKD